MSLTCSCTGSLLGQGGGWRGRQLELLGRRTVRPGEGIPELLGQGPRPVLRPPVSRRIPAAWVPWSPEAPFGAAPRAAQQELAAVGADIASLAPPGETPFIFSPCFQLPWSVDD